MFFYSFPNNDQVCVHFRYVIHFGLDTCYTPPRWLLLGSSDTTILGGAVEKQFIAEFVNCIVIVNANVIHATMLERS